MYQAMKGTIFSDTSEVSFELPTRLRDFVDIDLNSALASATAYIQNEDKVRSVKEKLYKEYWLQCIVQRFPFKKIDKNCFVSFQDYNSHRSDKRINEIAKTVTSILQTANKLNILNGTPLTGGDSIPQHYHENYKKIDTAEHIICFIGKDDIADNYFENELLHINQNIANLKVIPIACDCDFPDFFSSSLKQIAELPNMKYSLDANKNTYQQCLWMSELFAKLGLLTEPLKQAYNNACVLLKEKVDMEFSDQEILDALDRRKQANKQRNLGFLEGLGAELDKELNAYLNMSFK